MQLEGPNAETFRTLEQRYAALHAERLEKIRAWTAARDSGDESAAETARTAMVAAHQASEVVRKEAVAALQNADSKAKKTKDSDYVFITFILTQLPHGVIGLLIAVMFASALSSKAGEL